MRNPFLAIAANLIRTDRQLLGAIMDYLEIVDVLARRHADGTERSMVRHMDEYISYVDSLHSIQERPPSGGSWFDIRRSHDRNTNHEKEEVR